MRLVQYKDTAGAQHVAVVEDQDTLIALGGVSTTRELAGIAIGQGITMIEAAKARIGEERLDYNAVAAEGRLLAPITHADPAHFLVTGTGLTHLGSASARANMHTSGTKAADETDSMKMFRMGVEGGKPKAGETGVQPEWFYKGDGSIVATPGGDMPSPSFALDGSEEPEIAAIYVIDQDGNPVRIGFAIGNEFSDHVTERQNYLYLAHSKLRACSMGPELLLGDLPSHVEGTSRLYRDGKVIWEKPFLSGEDNMSHTLANLEYHHFKYDLFCRPGDVHAHFFGTATLSFADGIKTQDGDEFEIESPLFGRALRNRLKTQAERKVVVKTI
ncbi:MAG: GguC family protein [Thalassospira sp.]|uniref:AraD1 family protein n=1 Tax=Thalassospira sp. TaxID=1912094 RepID=UPI0032ED2D73|eukprot:TRINITY_DN15842_c0_g1_i1.p1 TRINITY_DN15842_c0_g1~~TRINITY_DN15842_c0_g1_i1.p1  ORF type:complete len:330 (-),score=74.10 TRINITY_DN15842_c0_g1_i1:176-1165(-)